MLLAARFKGMKVQNMTMLKTLIASDNSVLIDKRNCTLCLKFFNRPCSR